MASKAFLVMIVVISALAAPAMAEQIWVGDDSHWTLGFDYEEWAAGKEFHVGDTIVFHYQPGAHNVIQANQTEFQKCIVSPWAEPFTTGHTVITLEKPGKKWYICGFANHCSRGMKLVIDVLDVSEKPKPAPAPAPHKGWIHSKKN